MSKPQYLRKSDSPESIIVSIEVFVKYIFTITNNDKQFPKAYRYTLTSQIRNVTLDLHKTAYSAVSLIPRYRGQYKKLVKLQQKVYDRILDIKALLIVANSVAAIHNKAQVTLLLDNIVNAYNRWTKNTYNKYRNLPTKRILQQKHALQRELARQRREAWAALPRDEEGFVILKRRTTTTDTDTVDASSSTALIAPVSTPIPADA